MENQAWALLTSPNPRSLPRSVALPCLTLRDMLLTGLSPELHPAGSEKL